MPYDRPMDDRKSDDTADRPARWRLVAGIIAITLATCLAGALGGALYMLWESSRTDYGFYGLVLLAYPVYGGAGGLGVGLLLAMVWASFRARAG